MYSTKNTQGSTFVETEAETEKGVLYSDLKVPKHHLEPDHIRKSKELYLCSSLCLSIVRSTVDQRGKL